LEFTLYGIERSTGRRIRSTNKAYKSVSEISNPIENVVLKAENRRRKKPAISTKVVLIIAFPVVCIA
jgi:hypothetical protein